MLLILALLSQPIAIAADRVAVVDRHISENESYRAREKCDKWQVAQLRSTVDPSLREACARADWVLVEEKNSVGAWQALQRKWPGTALSEQAYARESSAALSEIGASAPEGAYLNFLKDYPGTPGAVAAETLAAEAAVRDCRSSGDALRIATDYPAHSSLPQLMERFLDAFVTVTFQEDRFEAAMRAPNQVPAGRSLAGKWVIQRSDGSVQPWVGEARRHLITSGVPEATVVANRDLSDPTRAAFPRCWFPSGGDWQLGVQVTMGTSAAFFAAPWEEGCGPDAPPVLFSVKGAALSGMARGPQVVLEIPTAVADESFTWAGDGEGRPPAEVPIARQPTDLVLVGKLLGSGQGDLHLIQPLNGRLPWYFKAQGLPPTAVHLKGGMRGSAVPDGYAVVARGKASIVQHGGEVWAMPPGDVRAWSPLAARVLGLDAVEAAAWDPLLPALGSGAWSVRGATVDSGPAGSTAVSLDSKVSRTAPSDFIRRAGEVLTVSGAWGVQLDDDPLPETFFSGESRGYSVHGVLDPLKSGGERLFIASATVGGEPFAFSHEGKTYVGVGGVGPEGGTVVEAWHFDAVGLERQVVR